MLLDSQLIFYQRDGLGRIIFAQPEIYYASECQFRFEGRRREEMANPRIQQPVPCKAKHSHRTWRWEFFNRDISDGWREIGFSQGWTRK